MTQQQMWWAVSGTAVLVVAILGVAIVIATGGDDEDEPGSTNGAPTATTHAATGTVTASPTAETTRDASATATGTPLATATPGGLVGLIDRVAEHGVIQLEKGQPVAFSPEMVLYFNTTCYACEGGYNLQRAYRAASGELVVDPIRPAGVGPSGGGAPYVHSFSLAGNGYDAFAIICTGNCGGISTIQPDSSAELWQSTDGGVTWESRGPVVLDSYISIAGIRDGRALVGHFSMEDPDAPPRWVWYPGQEEAQAPSDFEKPQARDVPGYGLSWTDEPDGPAGPLRVKTFSGSGIDLVRPRDPQLVWRLMEVTSDGFMIWNGYPPGSPSLYSYVAFASPDGVVDRVYAWKGYDFRVLDGLDDRVFIGNALTTDDTGMWVTLSNGAPAFEAVVIDFETEIVSPIRGLPPDTNDGVGGPFTFPMLALGGTFVRVQVEDDCLNVREAPEADSKSLRCFNSGVLLSVRQGLSPVEGWIPVSGPGDIEGWAASEFLSRAAGGAE